MHCEAVRGIIEDNPRDYLKREYAITEFNKRGVFTFLAGQSEMALSENYKMNAQKMSTAEEIKLEGLGVGAKYVLKQAHKKTHACVFCAILFVASILFAFH